MPLLSVGHWLAVCPPRAGGIVDGRAGFKRPAHRYVAVGASGGEGLDDLRELLGGLAAPGGSGRGRWSFTRPSTDQLSPRRPRRGDTGAVVIARQGEILEPGRIYVGEPADHLQTLVAGGAAGLVHGPGNGAPNPPSDLLFRSPAARAGPSAMGVVLRAPGRRCARTGSIHAGMTMWSCPIAARAPAWMPEHAIGYDGPDHFIGSPSAIPRITRRLCRHGDGRPAGKIQQRSETFIDRRHCPIPWKVRLPGLPLWLHHRSSGSRDYGSGRKTQIAAFSRLLARTATNRRSSSGTNSAVRAPEAVATRTGSP